MKFQGDTLNFYDFIKVFVFTTNHHLKEMDSACRNQQGDCDEVENSARPVCYFLGIVVEFMQLQRSNIVFQYINVGLGFQHLPRDLANVNAWKTMFDPYIK